MTCTACPALLLPMRGATCALGIRTATTDRGGYRVRHPLESCVKPRTDADVVFLMGIIARERAHDTL